MESQITCPRCKRTITNNPVIESAARGENLGSTFVTCECGEQITFWAITAQLREQNKPAVKVMRWIRSLFKA